ncbi:hypothetical protein OU426_09335 [Frigidibacter sp. RF13]|uniref:hypothetical protein n=1 Tax=Frigidibacter sp. RF13 TaxID=2997340 RepID=UPI002270ED1E|nr:hypothetical protein [Frigidibacter sp. RF13]MCY1127057.1 hypothetical protein [Frigidibacter sp. RF13]
MNSLTLTETPRKSLLSRLFYRAAPEPPILLDDGRHVDAAARLAIKDLSPHLLKDIGLTNF